jgi:hypothetical protein
MIPRPTRELIITFFASWAFFSSPPLRINLTPPKIKKIKAKKTDPMIKRETRVWRSLPKLRVTTKGFPVKGLMKNPGTVGGVSSGVGKGTGVWTTGGSGVGRVIGEGTTGWIGVGEGLTKKPTLGVGEGVAWDLLLKTVKVKTKLPTRSKVIKEKAIIITLFFLKNSAFNSIEFRLT